ncbi:MAG TPA: sigma-54 dependent transcriptional regulator [Gemmatimonadales bacterium]|nr:sigma-54 dependent transcriptional regulator [Gemmatimonadales bacterium]
MDQVLVIDDDFATRTLLTRLLGQGSIEVHTVDNGQAGIRMADEIGPDVVLLDLRLPDADGLSLLDTLKSRHPETSIIMMTAYGQVERAVEAMRKGATDFLEKPFTHPDKLRFSVRRALEEVKAQRELSRLSKREAGRSVDALIGDSEAMRQLRKTVLQIAQSEARTILILGESGTGKELVARALHFESPRRASPFVELNCAAITETLFESELFGHEKGAFTDAVGLKKGLMEHADQGTLFLDEVGEMAQASQAKLLRALQERAFRRLGGTRDIKVDVRVIAATNRSLEGLVREGRFREDLFYRLSVIPITVPPLRDRPEDILALARHFLVLASGESRKVVKGFTPATEQKLLAYSWPGNVRELRNVIERMVILTTGDVLDARDVPVPPQMAEPAASSAIPNELATLDDVERAHIRAVLAKVHGNRSAAARILGITRQTLRKKIGEPSTKG